jgi:release factor glutamine methyltransferase
MQIRELLTQAAKVLPSSPTARLDVEVLILHTLQIDRSYLYSRPERELTLSELGYYQQLLGKRQAGEPIAYILGQREFWSLPLQVTSATLIPRPETELLVELSLANLPADKAYRVADLGTGSGAIALAIAKERSKALVYAIDKSMAALRVAKANAEQLQLSNVAFLAGDWLSSMASGVFDIIVSNPPYLAADDPHLSSGDLRFEPRLALVADNSGLAAYHTIFKQARHCLKNNGWIYVEHGYNQAEPIAALLRNYGFSQVQACPDLAGILRVSSACLG